MSIFADRMTLRSADAAFTREVGRTLGEKLEGGEIVVLVGELGSGKTTFVKGLAAGLGVAETREVTSPTFLRIQEHAGRVRLHHVDAYRMDDAVEEFRGLGGDELLEGDGVTVVEWGERLLGALPDSFLTLRFAHGESEKERRIRVLPRGLRYAELAVELITELAQRHGEAPEGFDEDGSG
jgi:tRNA threonylcarbamoyladenosine biosynthesis protein TsaE